jgi:hypothetical protein
MRGKRFSEEQIIRILKEWSSPSLVDTEGGKIEYGGVYVIEALWGGVQGGGGQAG